MLKLTLRSRLKAIIDTYEIVARLDPVTEWDMGRRAAYDSIAEDLRRALREADDG